MAMEWILGRVCLKDIRLHAVQSAGRCVVTGMTVDGQLVLPTSEFWNDVFRRFRLNQGWACRKSHARKWKWLVTHFGDYQLPYCLVATGHGRPRLYPRPRAKVRRPRFARPTTLSRRRQRVPATALACPANRMMTTVAAGAASRGTRNGRRCQRRCH